MMEINCPVKENEELNVTIEVMGEKGDGLAKIEGYAIFVPDTKVGDEVRIKVNKVLPNYAFAEKI